MNYSAVQKKTEKVIRRNGKEIVLKKPGSSQFDPITGKRMDMPGTEFPGSALELQFDAKSIEGTEIRISDLLLMCVGIPAPESGDVIMVENFERKVIPPIKRFSPAAVVIYYEVFVR